MFFRSNHSLFVAHLRRNVNPKTWFYTSHNGVTLVVHAWFALAAMQNQHEQHTPGVHVKFWNIYRSCLKATLLFTDRSEITGQDEAFRLIGSVVGNNRELETFRHMFVLEPQALWVPNAEGMCAFINSPYGLGMLQNPDDLQGVIAYANSICVEAERNFR